MSVTAALLVVVAVRDPARPARDAVERAGSPYRTPVLWRLHGAATLLVVPQFVVAAFALVLLVDERGWEPAAAGVLLACVQVGGAGARLASGRWSDLAGSRTGPMRVLALVTAAVLAALTVSVLTGSRAATVALAVAGVVTVSSNGLSFTAVAEYAGTGWAGRALGVHTTVQNAVAVCVPPLAAHVIGAGGFGLTYGLTIGFPLLAAALVPAAVRPADTAAASAPGRFSPPVGPAR
jgi:predicted MFS family arabinose efflux permease